MTSAKRLIALRLSPAGHDVIRDMARRETDGNVSEMVRILLREAVAARMNRQDTP